MEEKKLIPNSTQIPNIIIDLRCPRLPEAEMRCILYVCRRTYGFHKDEDRISFSQFMNGIKNRENRILDLGTGLARASVCEALKNLNKAEAIYITKTTKGNFYKINLNMDIDKVVQLVDWFRKQTRIEIASRPKAVHLPYLQKKEKQRETKNMSDKPTFSLKEEIEKLLIDKRRHIQIIGLWIQEMNLKPENQEQIQSIIHRNSRPAILLKGYKNEDIQETIKILKRTEYLQGHFGIETITKFIDEVVATKKKKGPKIIKWEERRDDKGVIRAKPIFEVKK
jgi:hypothetical protein